jgi:hypothetical protein
MATTTIPELPDQTTLEGANYLVVQDGVDTKKMPVSMLTAASDASVNAHIADTTAAHAASSISASPSGGSLTGADVQAQLSQAASAIAANAASKQPLDPDLTQIASLTPTPDGIMQGEGGAPGAVWMVHTPAQVKTTLALTKTDVGLGNVDNTSDTNKPVSTAQQTSLDLKADKVTAINTSAPLVGGGDLSTTRTLSISPFGVGANGVVPGPTAAIGAFLRDDGTWGALTTAPRSIVTYTGAAVNATLSDAGAYLRFTGTNPIYTIVPAVTFGWAIGTQIDGISVATAMTLAPGAGVTLIKARTLVTVGAGSGWTIICVALNTWDVHGNFV